MVMRVTSRDIQLLNWINRFGFVKADQIALWMGVSLTTAYIRLKKLVDAGYLKHQRIFLASAGVYYLTRRGVYISGSPYSPLKKVILSKYYHDLLIVDVSLELVKHYGGSFKTERDIRMDTDLGGIGQKGHMSDGMLITQDKKIAVEVELHKKGKRRRDSIMQHYVKNFDVNEVWYLYGDDEIERIMQPYQSNMPYLKLLSLNTLLGSIGKSHGQLI